MREYIISLKIEREGANTIRIKENATTEQQSIYCNCYEDWKAYVYEAHIKPKTRLYEFWFSNVSLFYLTQALNFSDIIVHQWSQVSPRI